MHTIPAELVDDEFCTRIDEYHAFMSSLMVTIFAGDNAPQIDEVALGFMNECGEMTFVMNAVQSAIVEHFNASIDRVETRPVPSMYAVRYDFLRVLGRPYRLECMAILEGISPLHVAFINEMINTGLPEVSPGLVHASFKCADLDEYAEAMRRLQNSGLATLAQQCQSEYGVFSYWAVRNEDGHTTTYLKPRVNIRDAAPEEI